MKKATNQLLVLLFITTLFSACGSDMFNSVHGNDVVITKERKLQEDFSAVSISTGLDLYITQGENNVVTVEADENLHDIIITEVKNGVLKIYSEKNIWKATAKKVHVTIAHLNVLQATSGAHVYSESIIKTTEIAISATSGAHIDFEITAENISTSTTSGADITIAGTAVNHTASATSGSAIDANKLISETINVKATSGADIDIYAAVKIEANATSGAAIAVIGTATKVAKTANSGGSISINKE